MYYMYTCVAQQILNLTWISLAWTTMSNSLFSAEETELYPFEHIGTEAIHAGEIPEAHAGWPAVIPISLATTFKQKAPGDFLVIFITHYFFIYLEHI